MHVYLPPTGGLLNILVARPLSSELGTHQTVKARFWPWLEPSSDESLSKPCKLLPFRSDAGKGDALHTLGPTSSGSEGGSGS